MIKNFLLLFLALRAADLLNLAGGLWLVPKYVAPEDLGAVLPLTTLATVVAIPLFTIAMTALRESSRLRAEEGAFHGNAPTAKSQLRSFIRGIFTAVGVVTVLSLLVAAAVLPHFLERFKIADSLSGSLAVTAAFLGCVSPVYLDQLQAAKRFGTVSVIEVSAAALRLAVMAALMPFRALAGYFAGSVMKPLIQIFGPLLALRSSSATDPTPYWNRDNSIRLAKTFFLMLAYLALPMLTSLTENDLVRTLLPSEDSAGYYMATRISDLMNYVSYPLLFVMFPYVTDCAAHGKSHRKLTLACSGTVVIIAMAALVITDLFGAEIISLLPNGANYTGYAKHLPRLILFMAFGAAQSIITNAEVAAGRFSFLWWFVPMNLAYIGLLPRLMKSPTLEKLIAAFTVFAALRCLAALVQLRFASSDSDRTSR